MKILITNFYLSNRAGSEVFTVELARELKKRGHDVFVFSPIIGDIAKEITEKKIPVTNDIAEFGNEKFDLIHAQHNIPAILARSIFPDAPMVYMVHGTVPELEQPPSVDLGIGKYLVVSEKVGEHIQKKYKVSSDKIEILRNFIDLEKFRSKRDVNKTPKKLLVISNHYTDEVRNVIEKSCDELKIKHSHIGLPDNPVKIVEDHINDSDIVVTLGRGALEAMACERNLIVYDMHGGDGFIDENNFFEMRKHSFSGKILKIKYAVAEFKEELKKYDPETGKKLRKIIEQENSPEVIVDKLENIYAETMKNSDVSSQIRKNQLYREFNFLIREEGREQEIAFMKSSKFWKLREKYLTLKGRFLWI